MNSHTRTLIGLISCLLAMAGLWRAAERFDPVTLGLAGQYADVPLDPRPSDSCALPCTNGPSWKLDHAA
jgi:hypothetical protein